MFLTTAAWSGLQYPSATPRTGFFPKRLPWKQRCTKLLLRPEPYKNIRRHIITYSASPEPAGSASAPSEAVLDLARRYYTLQHPALVNKRYSTAIKEFTAAAVLAYECGHNEADVAEQLGALEGEELGGMKGFDPSECCLLVCLVWITLQQLGAAGVRRWAA
ncbi:hypothetical protein Agub_g10249, partial [Astrephomene gubernaculifera]